MFLCLEEEEEKTTTGHRSPRLLLAGNLAM
jgi:hypothetical protein